MPDSSSACLISWNDYRWERLLLKDVYNWEKSTNAGLRVVPVSLATGRQVNVLCSKTSCVWWARGTDLLSPPRRVVDQAGTIPLAYDTGSSNELRSMKLIDIRQPYPTDTVCEWYPQTRLKVLEE